MGEDKQRHSIRLGKMALRTAETIKTRVEYLVAHHITGVPLDAESCNWLTTIDDRLYIKLVAVALVEPRSSGSLGEFLDTYLAGRTDLKPSSRIKLLQTKSKLLDFFGSHKSLRSLTPQDAIDWRQGLAQPRTEMKSDGDSERPVSRCVKLSEATLKQHSGNAKTFFNEAVRRRLIPESPFRHLRSGATASRNMRHVSAAEAERILEACPNTQWKLIFALGRYAGLRVPSESHLLTWGDVNWEHGKLRVRSPKTEHHMGHEERTVPITAKLMSVLQDAFDAAQPGEERLVTLNHGGQSHRSLRRIVLAAGVEPWNDAFQTLRRSCEKEWALTFPQFAVSLWIGHSITVSGRHYANAVPDELFEKAAVSAAPKTKHALQNALQHAAAPACTAMNSQSLAVVEKPETREEFASVQECATPCNMQEEWSRGDSNPCAETVSQPRLHV